MNLWVIFAISWIGSWSLFALIFYTWSSLSRRLLERRYKPENDRGKSIEEFGTGIARGEDEGQGLQGQDYNPTLARDIADPINSTTSTSSSTTSSTQTITNTTCPPIKLGSFNEERWYGK